MRLRKLAGLMVGAVTAGVVSLPALAGPAQAAPSTETATQALTCTFGSFSIAYNADLTASVDGTAVTGALAEQFTPGMPPFVTVSKLKMDLATTIDGEAVTLTGTDTYSPSRAGNGSFDIPALSGTRTGTADPEDVAITGAAITITTAQGDSAVPCVVAAEPEPEPTELTATQALSCQYDVYTIGYAADLTASVGGTAVTGVLAEQFTPGMPPFVTVSKLKMDLAATIDGEAVTLTGTEEFSPARPGNSSFDFADLAGERTGTTAPEELVITGATITMTAMGTDNVIPCAIAADPEPTELTATQALSCQYDVYTIGYAADLTATVDGAAVTGVLAEQFTPGMPAFVTVSKLKIDVATTIDGEAVTLTGTEEFSPARPGNSSFDFADLAGERTGTTAPEELVITGATITMTAMGADNVIPCSVAVPATATTTALNGSSPAAAQVALSATVAPAAAGTVEFFEGATKVGEKAVASGAAAVALTGVSAGEHSYTATFVPTNPAAFVGSTSTVVKVTVAAVPKPGPTAACIKAQGDVKTTAAAVKKADAKVKSTKNAVKKATKAAKKAKGKKAKAAKAKLKKAKKAASSAAKAAKSAKAKNTAATNAVKANC